LYNRAANQFSFHIIDASIAELARLHPEGCFSLRQSGDAHLFGADFSPAVQKIGTNKTSH
jgi:hypothetical protein